MFIGYGVALCRFCPLAYWKRLNVHLLVAKIYQSKVGLFAWLGVVISTIVLIGFIVIEGEREGIAKLWIPIIGICTVGLSLGLPLFLLMRE